MLFKVTILGSGTCAVTKERSCSSYALQIGEQFFLLDIGFGSLRRLAEAGLNYRAIDAVVISHLHPDHVADLVPLLMALHFTPNFTRRKTLSLFGPPGLLAYLRGQHELHGDWVMRQTPFTLQIEEIDSEIQLGSCLISALPMKHKPVSYGYRLQCNSCTLAYSGDTGYCPEVVALFANVDLGILECSFPDELAIDEHLTPSLAGRIAQESGCRRLLLTHFYPSLDISAAIAGCRRNYDGPVEAAADLMSVAIGEEPREFA
ncbi:MAG TPA: ribonuclease Z [bacterium]|nr:ribonuclease Z [bacterium]HNT66753.1 ribonuclease Z [bacterium]